MLPACAKFLNGMRNDKILSNLLGKIFEDLHIDSRSPSIESMRLLPLYDLHAINLQKLGHDEYALELLEHVVKIRETALSGDHPDRLFSQHELACAYRVNGQSQKAVQLLDKMGETTLSEDHPDRLSSQHGLACAYKANGQIQKAVQLLEHVIKIKETTLSEDHPRRLLSQHMLAIAYLGNYQIQKAVQLLEHVVKIRETSLSEDHPHRLESQHELTRAYRASGQIVNTSWMSD